MLTKQHCLDFPNKAYQFWEEKYYQYLGEENKWWQEEP